MILRVLAAVVMLVLGVWAALVLSLTSPGGTPDGSPGHPFPPVMATPPKDGFR